MIRASRCGAAATDVNSCVDNFIHRLSESVQKKTVQISDAILLECRSGFVAAKEDIFD